MKSKWVIVLLISLVVAVGLGFFIYNKIEDSKYVEVKFIDGYNNEVLSVQKLEVGAYATVPEEPKHDECKFTGWYNEDKTKVEDFTKIEKDLVVYSGCDSYTYNVKFYDTIAKKVVDTQKVKYGGSAVAPDAPSHFGYTFVGWKGKFSFVKANLMINAIYSRQKAKYVVKYYTIDENNKESLYTTKTYSDYVNRNVSATIIKIGGYKFKSDYSKNVLIGKADIDNSLVLKVYYEKTKYNVTINGEENQYEYKDKIELPSITKTVTLNYEENEAVENKLSSNTVELTLSGYCKDSDTCKSDDLIKPGTVVTVDDDATYNPVWVMDLELLLPEGEGYLVNDENYDFSKWYLDGGTYLAESAFTFIEDTTLIAVYKKGNLDENNKKPYTVNVYRDGEVFSTINETGIVGEEILGIMYAPKVSGYNVSSYTRSIFISENVNENIINVYYVSDGTPAIEYAEPLYYDDELESVPNTEEELEVQEEVSNTEEEFEVLEEVPNTEEELEVLEEVLNTEEELEVLEEVPNTEEELEVQEEVPNTEEELEVQEEVSNIEEEPKVLEEVPNTEEEPEVLEEVPNTEEELEALEEIPIVEEVKLEVVEVIEESNSSNNKEETNTNDDVVLIETVEHNKDDLTFEE